MEKKERDARIQELEAAMAAPDFWSNPTEAQTLIWLYGTFIHGPDVHETANPFSILLYHNHRPDLTPPD